MPPSALPRRPPTLARLLFKYEEIDALRRLASDGGPPPRERLRALSRELPGSLRTLDALDPAELALRLEQLRDAVAAQGPVRTWMRAELAYHDALRRLLDARREGRLRREAPRGPGIVHAAISVAAAELALAPATLRRLVLGAPPDAARPQLDDELPPLSPELAAGAALGALGALDEDEESVEAPPEGFGADE